MTCWHLGGAHIVFPSNALDVAAHLQTEGRVKTTRRLIKEENLGIGHQSTCNTQTLLLTSAQTLLDRCTNNGVRLGLKSKTVDQVVDTLESLFLRNRTLSG